MNQDTTFTTAVTARQAGITLLEAMVVVAIIAILAAIAGPSFTRSFDKSRIVRASEAVLSDIRWARSESIKRNLEVRITYTPGANWSYSIHVDPAGSNTLLKTINGSEFKNTSLTTNFPSNRTTFERVRGTATNGTITLTSTQFSSQVTLSTLGRVRICGLEGYSGC